MGKQKRKAEDAPRNVEGWLTLNQAAVLLDVHVIELEELGIQTARHDDDEWVNPADVRAALISIEAAVQGRKLVKAETDGLRELQRKFMRLYNEVRVRTNGLQNLDGQIRSATEILDRELAKYPCKGSDDGAADAGRTETGGAAASS